MKIAAAVFLFSTNSQPPLLRAEKNFMALALLKYDLEKYFQKAEEETSNENNKDDSRCCNGIIC